MDHRLMPPITAGFEARRAWLLTLPVPADIYGASALFALVAGRDEAAANATLRQAAEWFDRPHPHGRLIQGEPDFTAMRLCRAWHRFGKTLDEATQKSMSRFFLQHDFSSIYQSENHALLFHSARHLMAAVWPSETFAPYRRSGGALAAEDGAWLKRFLRYRAGCGWGEFDSVCYMAHIWECLTGLFDFSPDRELRRLAGMAMDLLLADFEVDALQGMYGGAHGRIYPAHALDHRAEATLWLHYLYFGGEPPAPERLQDFLIDALDSAYRPHPVLVRLALERREPYENRERKHLHNVADVLPQEPLPGSIRKYTYWTPDYVLGCVQYQDPYPQEGCPSHPHEREIAVPPEQTVTAGYAHHQQHEWDLSFVARPDARLFTHHPGNDDQHNHWTGDRLCGCGHFFQNRGALVALYDIPAGQPCQWIHACVPAAAFDEIVEERGIVFVRVGAAYGALRLSAGYRWTREGEWQDREIVAPGARHGVICEAGRAEDFDGFAAFRDEVAANPVRFDAGRMELEYDSRRAGRLRIDTRGGRWLDDAPVDLDYPTHGSPFLQTPWRGTSSELRVGGERAEFDFTEEAAA